MGPGKVATYTVRVLLRPSAERLVKGRQVARVTTCLILSTQKTAEKRGSCQMTQAVGPSPTATSKRAAAGNKMASLGRLQLQFGSLTGWLLRSYAIGPTRSRGISGLLLRLVSRCSCRSPLRERNQEALHLQSDAVKAFVHRDVQDLALRADPEGDVAGQADWLLGVGLRRAGRNEGDLFPG